MTAPLHFHTIAELAPLIASGHLSSEDLTRACLGEIDAHDRALNAFITVLGARRSPRRGRSTPKSPPAAAGARCTAFPFRSRT